MFLGLCEKSGSGVSFGGKMGLLSFVVSGLLLVGCQAGTKTVVKSRPAGQEVVAPVASEPPGVEKSQDEAVPEEESTGPLFLANIDSTRFDPRFVKSRVKLYGDKAERWQLLEDKMRTFGLSHEQEKEWLQCTGLLSGLVSGYEAVLHGQGDPLAVIRKDISFAESDCDEMFAVHTALIPELLTTFQDEASAQAEAVIDYYAERKEYQIGRAHV